METVTVDPAVEEEQTAQQAGGGVKEKLSKIFIVPHPISVFFHFFFKLLAILSYFILITFVDSFSLVFIIVILLMALDFWTVQNVTGRLLVGLRWSNEILEDGTSHWHFESLEGQRKISTGEAILFWVGLIGFPAVWVLLMLLALVLLDPERLIVCIVACVISCPNIYGYLRCAKDSRSKIQKMAKDYAGQQAKEYTAAAVKEYAKSKFSFGSN